MKHRWPTIIALLLGPTLVSARLGNDEETAAPVGQKDREERRLVTFNPVPEWIDLTLNWIGLSERGPT